MSLQFKKYTAEPEATGRSKNHAKYISEINHAFANLDLHSRLTQLTQFYRTLVFTTSFGVEDQAVFHSIATAGDIGNSIRVATLETGRLFPETMELMQETGRRYGLPIEQFQPDLSSINDYIETYGLNGFYESVEARHKCCAIRKLQPLKRALEGADVWMTGVRREQSAHRLDTPFAEWDMDYELVKVNIIADWSKQELDQFIETHGIPVNPLHGRGYPSIGCQPCTRAIKPGEDERAGRWWWENENMRECGLHVGSRAFHG